MAECWALEDLFTKVRAELDALDDGAGRVPAASQSFGWREPAKQIASTPRIVWTPGAEPTGDLGDIRGSRRMGEFPRVLATLGERCTVYLSAEDEAATDDELRQYTATRALFDLWYAAMHRHARGIWELKSVSWIRDRKVARRGAALRIVFAVDAALPDIAAGVGTVTSGTAAIETTLQDNTETVTAPTAE